MESEDTGLSPSASANYVLESMEVQSSTSLTVTDQVLTPSIAIPVMQETITSSTTVIQSTRSTMSTPVNTTTTTTTTTTATTTAATVAATMSTLTSSTTPTLSSDQTTIDHSLLIKPIKLKDSTIRTIVDCVRNGTPEVRDLLVSECELIFECRVCRSLHRSLANFIAHKRVYCKEHCCESMPLFEYAEDEVTVVQPESPIEPTPTASVAHSSADIPMASTDAETPSSNSTSPNEIDGDATCMIGGNSAIVIGTGPGARIIVSPQRIYNRSIIKKRTTTKSEASNSELITRSNSTASSAEGGEPDVKPRRRPASDFLDGILKTLKERSERRLANKSPLITVLSNIDGNPNAVFQRSVDGSIDVDKNIPLIAQDDQESTQNDDKHGINNSNRSINQNRGRDSVETVKTNISVDVTAVIANASEIPSPRGSPVPPLSSSTPPPPLLTRSDLLPFGANFSTTHKLSLLSGTAGQLQIKGTIKSVPCIRCRTLFTSIKTLIAHLKSVHSKNRVYYMCIFCPIKFSNSWAVGRHIMRKHNRSKAQVNKLKERIQQKAFQNVLEDRNTSDDSELDQDVVDAPTIKSSRTVKSNRRKINKKSRIIPVRSPSSPSSVTLSDISSLECRQCGIKFSNLSNCRRHVAKHIGLNRYKCRFCAYQSYHRYNVCYHMKSAHPRQTAGKDRTAIKNSLVSVESVDNTQMSKQTSATVTMSNDSNRRKTSRKISSQLKADVSPETNVVSRTVNLSVPTTPTTTGFNISTRRHPRVFDTTPYRRDDCNRQTTSRNRHQSTTSIYCKSASTLETRSRSYAKMDNKKVNGVNAESEVGDEVTVKTN